MKKLLLLSAISLIASSGFASESKPYIEGRITENSLKADYSEYGYSEKFKDNTFGASLELGLKFEQFRVGLEGYYNDTMEDKVVEIIPAESESRGFFLNTYYDFVLPEIKKVKPYIGIGVGYSWLEATLKETPYTYELGIRDKDFSWNIGFGVGYELNQSLDLTLGYRYENLGEIKSYDTKTDFTNQKLSLGLRYTF
jgi:opacity protein-like surface antigen